MPGATSFRDTTALRIAVTWIRLVPPTSSMKQKVAPFTRLAQRTMRLSVYKAQLTLMAVSSRTKDVWLMLSSVPVNFSVTVCPANDASEKLCWA